VNKESHKVGIATAIGAALGALLAHKLGPWFWIIGVLAGSLIDYFSYEFKTIIRAIPHAFRAATCWRPTKHLLVRSAWTTVLALGLISWLLLLPNTYRMLTSLKGWFVFFGTFFIASKTSLAATAIGAIAGYILGYAYYAVVTEHWLRPRGYIRA